MSVGVGVGVCLAPIIVVIHAIDYSQPTTRTKPKSHTFSCVLPKG